MFALELRLSDGLHSRFGWQQSIGHSAKAFDLVDSGAWRSARWRPGGKTANVREDLSDVVGVRVRFGDGLDNSSAGANLQMNWETDFATLTSITVYLNYGNNQAFDYDSQPLMLFHEDEGQAELTLWFQELRLLANSEDALTWLVGAMYAEDEVEEQREGFLTENVLVLPTEITRGYTQKTESWAVYGQVEYALADAWKIHGSLRYTDEEKNLEDAYTFAEYLSAHLSKLGTWLWSAAISPARSIGPTPRAMTWAASPASPPAP